MMRVRAIAAVGGLLLLAGCGSYPTSALEQGAGPSGLYFSAPAEAEVLVDGSPAGRAGDYDGRKGLLNVAPGVRQVTVRQAGRTLYDGKVFVGAGARMEIRAR